MLYNQAPRVKEDCWIALSCFVKKKSMIAFFKMEHVSRKVPSSITSLSLKKNFLDSASLTNQKVLIPLSMIGLAFLSNGLPVQLFDLNNPSFYLTYTWR